MPENTDPEKETAARLSLFQLISQAIRVAFELFWFFRDKRKNDPR